MIRLWPQGLFGRTLLVLALGLVLSHAASMAVYHGKRHEALLAQGGEQAAERLLAVAATLDETPLAQRTRLARSLGAPGLRILYASEPLVAENRADGPAKILESELRRLAPERTIRLAYLKAGGVESLTLPGRGMMHGPGGGMGPGWGGGMGPGWGGGMGYPGPSLRIALGIKEEGWLNAILPLPLEEPVWHPRFAFSFILVTLLTLAITGWAIRRATKPLETFARAAERLGTDIGAPPLAEDGPAEVRRASRAFNEMQDRLRRFIDDRARMLGAIAHDLRTPLTRMRLRAEFVEDDDSRAKMLADLAEMETMIAEALALARQEAVNEPRQPLDLDALLRGLAEDARLAGRQADYQGEAPADLMAAPTALKRALVNLIDNALKYGQRVRLAMNRRPDRFDIWIDDDGPGIPESEREKVFAPFYRLEGSRSRETGGTGLGLALARSAVRAHGGDIHLENRPEGGLRAIVTLPRTPITYNPAPLR